MEDYLGIAYKLSKSENFDDYMKALGVGLVSRKIASSVTPIVKLTENGGVYSFTTISNFKSFDVVFKPNIEFQEETADGRKVKSVVKFENNKMIQTQVGEKTTVIVREFGKDQLVATFTIGDIVATRYYDRVK